MAVISRTDADAVIETQVANEIFEGVIKESKALSMFKRLPNMTSDKTKIRVLDTLPVAYFVDESQNNGRKNLTKVAWDKKFINAAELAVIVPIKENVLNEIENHPDYIDYNLLKNVKYVCVCVQLLSHV